MLSKFNGTSTPKGSYRAKTGDNDSNVNPSHYSLSTALCESIRYQAKSEQNVRQDLIPRVGHGEVALSTPAVAESRLIASDSDEQYAVPGYDIYHNDPEQVGTSRPSHGLVTYVRNGVLFTNFGHYTTNDLETTYMQFNVKDSTNTVFLWGYTELHVVQNGCYTAHFLICVLN